MGWWRRDPGPTPEQQLARLREGERDPRYTWHPVGGDPRRLLAAGYVTVMRNAAGQFGRIVRVRRGGLGGHH